MSLERVHQLPMVVVLFSPIQHTGLLIDDLQNAPIHHHHHRYLIHRQLMKLTRPTDVFMRQAIGLHLV